MILKSRYVVPVTGRIIENGAVMVNGDRIAAVGPASRLDDASAVDFGDAVICPGLVNAHTHLELTHLAGRIPPSPDFVGWLGRLVAVMADSMSNRFDVENTVRKGLAQSLASGVTMVGDITGTPAWTRGILAESVVRGVSFGEVIAIGSRRHLLGERLDAAASAEHRSDRLRIGISPHAPYTVEPEAMRACARRARDIAAPMCIHLAETADEELFTRSRSGPLTDHLRDLGVWDDGVPIAGCGPVELASRTQVLGPRTIVAHANYVSDADIASIAGSGAAVAYCPRTHDAFGHPPHRFREMLAAGINVCVGTDSLASNPSLSILEELRFLRRAHRNVDSETLLAMGTLHGARALGFGEVTGSISEGKLADLVVIPLDRAGSNCRWGDMLESSIEPLEVYVSGLAQLHNDNRQTAC